VLRVFETLGVERVNMLGGQWAVSSPRRSACSTLVVLANSSYYRRTPEELTQISPRPPYGHNSSICPGCP
jgi:hypothetical protein